MIDVNEFCKAGSKQPLMSKVLPRNIVSSFKSWMHDYSDRKLLHSMLRVVEQLQEQGALGALKKHIKGSAFNCSEKHIVASIVDLITKKQGVEKKGYHAKRAKALAAAPKVAAASKDKSTESNNEAESDDDKEAESDDEKDESDGDGESE